MADFCKDCSIEMFGRDTGDLKGLITEDDFKACLLYTSDAADE